MSLSTPQIESRIQFSPLPQDIEVNDRHVALEPCKEGFDWEAIVIVLRLVLVGMFLVGLALRQRQIYEPTTFDPIAPKFFLDSLDVPLLKVSEGDVTLTVSNVMNFSTINILRLEAKMSYEENKTLVVITLQSEAFLLDVEETKRVNLRLSTTLIVNDTVVQAIAERGVTRFSLHMSVTGEVGLGYGWVQTFTMYPKCRDLEVKVVAADQRGVAATMIDRKPRECIGPIEWRHVTYVRDSV